MNNKQENVVNMLKRFGEILKIMPDGKLREEFNAFVYTLTFGKTTLPKIIETTEKYIEKASTVQHQDLQTNAKASVKFWKKIQDDIVNTYKENKEADDG